MRRLALLLFSFMAGLLMAVPVPAAQFYAVRLAQKADSTTIKPLREAPIFPGSLWLHQQGESEIICSSLFMHRREAEQLRQELVKFVPEATVIALKEPPSPRWLPYFHQATLTDLGYSRPIVAQGYTAYASFSFPWRSSFSVDGGTIRLFLTCSPLLNERSAIKVVIEGIPVISVGISGDNPERVIDVPLDKLHHTRIGSSLDVQLYGHLTITDDRCIDEPTGNLWMLLDNASFLRVKVAGPPASIRDFVADPTMTFNLVPQNLDRPSIAAMCRLAAMLGALAKKTASPFVISRQAAMGPNIFIGDYEDDLRLCGNNLYATPKGVSLLASRWFSALVFNRVAQVETVEQEMTVHPQITFADLGLDTKVMRGIGDLTFQVPFTTLQLGAWPARLSCTLVFVTTPVRERERAFLKVKLNGVLIAAYELMGGGSIMTQTILLPQRYLRFANTVEFAVSYYLNRGDCQGSIPEMEVSIFKDSFFTVHQGRSKPPLTLTSFPAMLRGKGAVVIDDLSLEQVKKTARLLAVLARGIGRPLQFDLVDFNNYSDNKTYHYGIFLLRPENLAELRPIVDLAPPFQIVHPLTHKVLLRCDLKTPVAVLQTFYDTHDLPLLVFSEQGEAAVSRQELIQLLLHSQNANVAIMKDAAGHAFEIGEKLRVVYPLQKDLSYYWNQYRLVMFVLLAVLVLIFLFYLFRKLAKR